MPPEHALMEAGHYPQSIDQSVSPFRFLLLWKLRFSEHRHIQVRYEDCSNWIPIELTEHTGG